MYFHFVASLLILCLIEENVEAQFHGACVTPNNETATCEIIFKCKTFIDVVKSATKSQEKFMRESLCGLYKDVPVVCCGTLSDYKTANRPKREVQFPLNPALPDDKTCGQSVKSDLSESSNIALRGEFPWSARIQYRKPNLFSCEGALINSRYVLTSGLCTDAKSFKQVGNLSLVRLGQQNCDEATKGCPDGHIDFGVEEIIQNPNYGPLGSLNHDDIALLRLDKEVTFSDAIRPVCLPKPDDAPPGIGEYLTEIGWYKASAEKLKAKLPVTSLEACRIHYNKYGFNLTQTHLCAGGLPNSKCAGISGGSLIKVRDGGRGFLEGIVSFGPAQCGTIAWPNVYTNVRPYLEWIHKTVKA